jgi:type III restriction enzyme
MYRRSQGYADISAQSPAQRGEIFAIPVLAIRQGDLFEELNATHIQEAATWTLKHEDATLNESDFPSQRTSGQQAEITMSADGHVIVGFIDQLHQQLSLLSIAQWNVGQLIHWLELNIPHIDLEPDDIGIFLEQILRGLMDQRGLSLDYLIHNKYKLRDAVERKINDYRRQAYLAAYQHLLDLNDLVVVRSDIRFAFDPTRLPPYPELYRGPAIPKHYFDIIGDMNDDEVKCAQYISQLSDLEFWLRNPVRTDRAFSIQTQTDRFYPDFVCKLNGDRYLVVEYKSLRDWTNDDSKEKRHLGELWAARSHGQCYFSMPRGTELDDIRVSLTR